MAKYVSLANALLSPELFISDFCRFTRSDYGGRTDYLISLGSFI